MPSYHVIPAFLRGFRSRTWVDFDCRGRCSGALYILDHMVSYHNHLDILIIVIWLNSSTTGSTAFVIQM